MENIIAIIAKLRKMSEREWTEYLSGTGYKSKEAALKAFQEMESYELRRRANKKG